MKLSSSLSFAAALVLAGSGCSLIVDGALTGGGPPPSSCEGLDDGTPCERMGITAPLVCLRAVCTNSRCGDGLLDTRPKADGTVEACDDGNGVGGDGCEVDCTVTVGCLSDDDCIPLDDECIDTYCETSSGECLVGPITDGTECVDDLGGSGACMSGLCIAAGCGDGTLDAAAGEQCDDGNLEYGDGCSPFCKPECTSNTECSQDVCVGVQECMTSTAGNGGALGVCVETSSPIECGDPACSYCDSSIGACVPTLEADVDGDGYASPTCGGDDCNDGAYDINPGRTEECDADMLDVNCNPGDEPASTEWFADCDGDGYPAADAAAVTACERPAPPSSCAAGYWTSTRPVSGSLDCLDDDAAVSPGQRGYFTRPYEVGRDTSFDYDCNGRAESQYARVTSPSTYSCGRLGCDRAAPVTAATTALLVPIGCGDAATLYYCDSSCERYASTVRYYVQCH